MAIATTNPATGEVVRTFDALTDAEVQDRLERAAVAFRAHRRTTYAQRSGWMRATADLLDAEVDQIAALMTLEMGKTLKAAKAEVAKCASGCRYYAEHAERLLAGQDVDAAAVGAIRAYVRWEPLGPVLAVMPWNFPLWQAFRFAAPALMAGNVGLLKHASNVPQTALLMEDLFRRGGFPDDVFQTLLIGSGQVEAVLRDRRVAAVTLTGSGPAGQSVAAIAGSEIKKSVLELGGSDPFVVMPSADLERAATVAAIARCQNNGQSCIAAKRFIVHEQVADRFEELFADALRALVVGDPTEEGTDVGPLATEQGREDVEELVADAVGKGARVVVGSSARDRRAGEALGVGAELEAERAVNGDRHEAVLREEARLARHRAFAQERGLVAGGHREALVRREREAAEHTRQARQRVFEQRAREAVVPDAAKGLIPPLRRHTPRRRNEAESFATRG